VYQLSIAGLYQFTSAADTAQTLDFLRQYDAEFGNQSAQPVVGVPAQYGAIKTKLNSWAWIKEDKFPKFYLKEDNLPSLFHKPFHTSVLK
jgi:hypothetical protein